MVDGKKNMKSFITLLPLFTNEIKIDKWGREREDSFFLCAKAKAQSIYLYPSSSFFPSLALSFVPSLFLSMSQALKQ